MLRPLPAVLLAVLPVVAAGCHSAAAATAPAAAARPNLLFIMADDHAFQAISAYDGRRTRTPNIDRIAAGGMRFDRCFVGNSICAPARATILTGLHSHANGVIDNRAVFDGGQPTFPKMLRAAGYQTAIIGKWHLKSTPTGFDHYEVLQGQGPYYNPVLETEDGPVRHHGYTTEILTERALTWLCERRDAGRPFLLMLHHKAPHRNWQPGPRELDLFEGVDIPEPATLFDDYSGRTAAAAEQEMTVARHLTDYDLKLVPQRGLDEEQQSRWQASYGPRNAAWRADPPAPGPERTRRQYQRFLKDYLRVVAAVDRSVGRVLDTLDRLGLAANTVVVYTSDQGFYLGEHGWFDKRWMYEESFRTPLLVRWPGVVAPGSVNVDLVQNIDFAPTFLELAGLEPPAWMHGRSLVPLLRGRRPADWRRSLYYHYYEYPDSHRVARHRGVRTDRYKLISFPATGEWELYDLERDPRELHSVWGDPAYAEVAAELRAELDRLAARYGDLEPDKPREEFYAESAARLAAGVEAAERLRLPDPRPGELRADSIYATPLALGVFVTPPAEEADGVIVAHGGASFGYALWLDRGRPCFAVRDQGRLFAIRAPERLPAGRECHLAAALGADGRLELFLDGDRVAAGAGHVLGLNPQEGMAIGSDPGSAVGDYEPPFPFPGRLRELVLWQGEPPAGFAARWAAGD
ncbi:MAG: DUF4976 domain-containing protein [Planctomycetota bacterium]|nr:MAG: DUF4976 domain-containing protein [Planctomycetota bacterium]